MMGAHPLIIPGPALSKVNFVRPPKGKDSSVGGKQVSQAHLILNLYSKGFRLNSYLAHLKLKFYTDI